MLHKQHGAVSYNENAHVSPLTRSVVSSGLTAHGSAYRVLSDHDSLVVARVQRIAFSQITVFSYLYGVSVSPSLRSRFPRIETLLWFEHGVSVVPARCVFDVHFCELSIDIIGAPAASGHAHSQPRHRIRQEPISLPDCCETIEATTLSVLRA